MNRDGRSIGRVAAGILAVVFFLGVLVAYYAGHKPVSGAGAMTLLAGLGDLALALMLVSLAGGLGRRLASGAPLGPVVGLVVQAALGLGLMALVTLALLWMGVLTSAVAWAVVVVVALVSGRSTLRWLKGWSALRALGPRSTWEYLAAVAAVLFLAPALVEAAAPPVHFDALVYHLELPRRFLMTGSLFGPADNLYWGMPLNGEMLYTLAFGLGRAQTAALVGFAVAGLTCLGAFALAAETGRPAAWASLLALLAGPSVAAAAGWGYVDWWAGFFGLATIAVVLRMKEGLPARWAALAGVLAGFAAGVKYSAAIALAAGLAALLAAVPTRRGVRLAAIFLAAGAAVWLPWLIKNFEGKGAPFYPYLGSTASISAVRQSAVRSSVAPPPLSHSLVVPLAATVLGHEQSPGFASDIGPLLLALLPGLFFLPSSERRPLLPLAFFLFTGWISWAVAGRVSGLLIQTRLYFVLLPAWAVLAGCGFQGYTRLSLGTVRGSRLVGAMTALVVGLSLTASLRAAAQANALAPILGSESPETYLSRRLGSYFASQESLGRLPGGSRTLFLWEPRGLYCPTECGPDAWIDEWLVARRTYPSAEAARQAWTARGFTHLLLFRPGRAFVEREDARYTAEDWTSLDELLGQATEVEAIGDAYTLYRLD